MLLRHALQWDRARLYTQWDGALPGRVWDEYRRLLDERATGRPVHYVVGAREFLGLTFAVDERVMIPRPETEVLVEFVTQSLKERASVTGRRAPSTPDVGHTSRSPEPEARQCVVDVGTGSGCVTVSLARRLPGAIVYAIDISAGALDVARGNAARHGVAGRIVFLQGDLLHPLPPDCAGHVSAVVSNPPYIPVSLRDTLPREISRFEPTVAVFVDGDGIMMHQRLIADAPHWLEPSGILAMEIAAGQADAVVEAMRRDGRYAEITVRADYGGTARIVAGTRLS